MKKILLLWVFLCSIVNMFGQVDLEEGLVAYYPFNASADDYSVYENHGQLSSFVDRVNDRFEIPYAAYEFDDRHDIIITPHGNQLDITGDFTVSAWVYPSEIDSFSFLNKGSAVFPPYLLALTGIGNSMLRIETEDGTFSIDINSGYTLNEWQLFTGIRSGNVIYLYRNNILIGQTSVTGNNIVTDEGLKIGARIATNDQVMPRMLDEVRVYNRAINIDEIEALYQFKDQCPEGPVVINSLDDLNIYVQNFPDCTSLPQGLTISGETITELSAFDSLLSIYGDVIIENNPNLISLTGFEDLLEIFDGDLRIINNDILLSLIEFARGVTIENKVFEVSDNSSLLDINGFDSVRLPSEFIVKNNESLINLQGITLIEVDNIVIDNNNSLISLSGLGSLDEVGTYYIENNSNMQGLGGLPNFNLVIRDGIYINNNDQLTDISSFKLSNGSGNGVLEITNNDNLSLCSTFSICINLNNFDELNIFDNAFGCNSVEEIITNCELDLNHVFGSVKFDSDNDNCDDEDYNVNNILIEISNSSSTYTTLTNINGVFSTFINETGYFDVTIIDESLPDYFQIEPASQEIFFNEFSTSEQVEFCLTTTDVINDLKITLLPLNDARPGFETNYQIVYENIGTTILSGDISLDFDIDRQTFLNAFPSEDNIVGNTISWNYTDLYPFETKTINVNFNTLAPPINESGDFLTFNATINPITDDANDLDNVYQLNQTVVNSQDPNDKQVLQGSEIFEEQVGEYLDYVIRFQNVGTADAINVRVDDILSNHFNLNTFRQLTSSHDYRIEIIDGDHVSFIFEDINLPPEQNDPEGSNGFIAFQVKTNTDLIIGDIIENTASIYFDFNDAIVTNTVSTEVVEFLSTNDVNLASKIKLVPNPVSEVLTISLSENIVFEKAIVYSLLGEKLIETSEKNIDFSNLSEGMYFVEISTNRDVVSKKIIKN